jgi:hypothetical protein
VLNASPTIKGNTFDGCAVGVQVSAVTCRHLPKPGEPKPMKDVPVPPQVKPVCKDNVCTSGVALWDERTGGSQTWELAYRSPELQMQPIREWNIVPARGDRTRVALKATSGRGGGGKTYPMTVYSLKRVGGGYAIDSKVMDRDPADPSQWPYELVARRKEGKRTLLVAAVPSVVSRRNPGGSRTHRPPAKLLLIVAEPGRPGKLLWVSETLTAGTVTPALADATGDGRAEILVATGQGRRRSSKGQICIYEWRKDKPQPAPKPELDTPLHGRPARR